MKALSFCAISLSVAFCTTAAPIVISNNLGQLTQPGVGLPDPITSTVWNAARFRTDANTYTLNTVTLALELNSFGSATLYSDQSGAPGVALAALPSSGQSCVQQICLATHAGNGATLSPNTNYWIVYSMAGGWAFTLSNAGDGPGFQAIWARTSNAGSTWTVSNGAPLLMSVTADIPEPKATAIFLLALTGLVLIRRPRP